MLQAALETSSYHSAAEYPEAMRSHAIQLAVASSPFSSVWASIPFGCTLGEQGDDPLVVDMATSSTAFFALVEARRSGRPVPDDIGFDSNGAVTTDAAAILNGGAMRSFDRCPFTSSCGAPCC